MEKIRQIEEVENILVAAALLPWPANRLQYDGKDWPQERSGNLFHSMHCDGIGVRTGDNSEASSH